MTAAEMSDIKPLLEEEEDGDVSTDVLPGDHHVTVRKPQRSIIVEPLVFGYSLIAFPCIWMSPQYVVKKVEEELRLHDNFTGDTNFSYCSVSHDDPAYHFEQKVRSEASLFLMWLQISTIIPAIFMSLLLGSYSDRAGRKYAMLPPIIGTIGRTFVYVLVMWLDLPKEVLFANVLFEGFCGSWSTLIMGCFSYVSDTTTSETRGFRIVILELGMMVPIALSSIAIGAWIDVSGFLLPFLVLGALQTLLLAYVIFLVPETIIPVEPPKTFFSLEPFIKSIRMFTTDDGTNRRWKLILLAFALFFPLAGLMNDVDTLFLMNAPLCWNSFLIGINIAVGCVANTLGGFVGLKVFYMMGLTDLYISLISGVVNIAKYIYKAFVVTTFMMFTTNFFLVVTLLFDPLLRSHMSTLVKAEEYGAVFAGISVIEMLALFAGSVVFDPIYAATTGFMTGFVYLVIGAVVVFATLLVAVYIVVLRIQTKGKKESGVIPDPKIE